MGSEMCIRDSAYFAALLTLVSTALQLLQCVTSGAHMHQRLTLLCFLVLIFPVSANAQHLTDSMGFNWDFAGNGSVNDGSNDAFDGGIILQVGGEVFNGSGQGNNQDGMIIFGPQTMGGVTVTRHVMLSKDPPGLVYADSYHNPGGESATVTPMIQNDFGDSATPQVKANSEAKMSALLYMHQPNRPLIAFHFGNPETEYLPTLSGSGDNYQFTYPPLELKSGDTKSIGYFVGQRQGLSLIHI